MIYPSLLVCCDCCLTICLFMFICCHFRNKIDFQKIEIDFKPCLVNIFIFGNGVPKMSFSGGNAVLSCYGSISPCCKLRRCFEKNRRRKSQPNQTVHNHRSRTGRPHPPEQNLQANVPGN
uniref:Uncharacterized protein n=1 Tax=Cacopsylla melanoneura TaxID=428564 RepID=A0A8D9BWB1_9HEMI